MSGPTGPPATADDPVFRRIAIIGCGLIGGSIALASRQRWPGSVIVGIDRADVLAAALGRHALDAGRDDLAAAADADLIVLAAPVRQNIDILDRLADHVPGPVIVTDVGSTKVTTREAASGLPPRLRFIGGHPLAGAAGGGIQAARADLFAGRPWLLTIDAQTLDDDIRRVEGFVSGLGARPQRLDADSHDRLLAYLSHLPQLTASALMHVVGAHAGEDGLALAGRGLRDTTRLAASPADIWRDVVATNCTHVAAALDDLIAVLTALRADLGDGARLGQVFASAAAWKTLLARSDAD